ncbi:DUF4062 domain-containing protein [Mesorhizobium sp. M0924]|uniref:DUF4062 domain-containing protein n=1 Tax=unclassified Mesorhizobium TaxID=325217 RepID=UPI00333A3BEE
MRHVTVFISSTFRDMHAERDALHQIMLPELREQLATIGVTVEMLDLRWGVETLSAGSELQRRLKVLQVCLDEIERSRPFFIALLGDRYGWCPPDDYLSILEPRLPREHGLKSMTEIEIHAGIIRPLLDKSPVQAFVYQRRQLPFHDISAQEAHRYSDHAAGDFIGQERLERLRKVLRELVPDRFREYHAEWDHNRSRIGGLQSFCRQVLQDLLGDIRSQLGSSPTPSVEDASDAFFKNLATCVVGRSQIVDQILEFSTGEDGGAQVFSLIGERGSGKSAVLAKFIASADRSAILLTNAASAGVENTRISYVLVKWCRLLSIVLGVPFAEPSDEFELDHACKTLMQDASRLARVIVVLDGVDEMEQSDRSRHLAWLPEHMPANVRIVLSSSDRAVTQLLRTRLVVKTVKLPGLDVNAALALMDHETQKSHRTLPPSVVAVIAAKRHADGTLAMANPLWLITVIGQLNDIDGDELVRTECGDGDHEVRIVAMLESLVEDLPTDQTNLYDRILNRAERRFGQAETSAMCVAIGTSMRGLRATDLDGIVSKLNCPKWSPLIFAQIRRSLAAHLHVEEATGIWSFRRSDMRHAISTRYGPTARLATEKIHGLILSRLDELPERDSLKHTAGFHAVRSGNGALLAAFTLRLARFSRGSDAVRGWSTIAQGLRDADTTTAARAEIVARLLLGCSLVRNIKPGDETNRLNAFTTMSHQFEIAIRENVSLELRAAWNMGCLEAYRRLCFTDDFELAPTYSRLATVALRMRQYSVVKSAATQALLLLDEYVGARTTSSGSRTFRTVAGQMSIGGEDSLDDADFSHGKIASTFLSLDTVVHAHRYRAVVLRTLARSLTEQGEFLEAYKAISVASAILEMLGDRVDARFMATVRVVEGNLALKRDQLDLSCELYRSAITIVDDLSSDPNWGRHETFGNTRLAFAELRLHSVEAKSNLAIALSRLGADGEVYATSAVDTADEICRSVPSYRAGLEWSARARLRLAEIERLVPGRVPSTELLREAARRFLWLAEADPSDFGVRADGEHLVWPSRTVQPGIPLSEVEHTVNSAFAHVWDLPQ